MMKYSRKSLREQGRQNEKGNPSAECISSPLLPICYLHPPTHFSCPLSSLSALRFMLLILVSFLFAYLSLYLSLSSQQTIGRRLELNPSLITADGPHNMDRVTCSCLLLTATLVIFFFDSHPMLFSVFHTRCLLVLSCLWFLQC